MEQKRQNKQKRRAAFTLAEFLTAIAIVGILASLSFVVVIRYQRKLRRLEMDQTAKEIFLAAQNHLTLEVSNGTIPRLLHMEAQGEFSDDQKQAKLGISVENTVLAEEKEEISTRFSMCRKNRQGSLNRNKKSLAVRQRWCLRM
ncbi:MAG: type II secretion system protein [Clostridium fessum]